jgi:hypothetical protein
MEGAIFVGAEERATTSEEVAGACRTVVEGLKRTGRTTVGRPWTGVVHAVGALLCDRRRESEISSRNLMVRMW